MASYDDIQADLGNGARLRVEGLAKFIRQAQKAGASAEDMRELMHRVGMVVVTRSALPARTSALDNSVRAGRGKTKAVVRAGSAKVPYAGVINYGWPARGILPAAHPLQDTLAATRGDQLAMLEAGINEILVKNNLN